MSKQHTYTVEIRWTGNRGTLTSGYRAYSRDHLITASGKPPIEASSDPAFRGDSGPPSKQGGPDKNKDWGNSYGITWDDSSQGPELYEGFIKAAIEHAILPNAAWYCWHASRRQAMVEGVWGKFGAFGHQQIVWAKDRGILTRSYYLWQHEPCFFGWLKGNKPPRVSDDYPSTVWTLPTVKVRTASTSRLASASTSTPSRSRRGSTSAPRRSTGGASSRTLGWRRNHPRRSA
jgi:hypothetical protein